MLENPHVTETEALLVAKVPVTTPRDKIHEVMGPAISEVYAIVLEQGRSPVGPWFTHHLRIDPAVFDFEACVPVDQPVAAAGRVVPGDWPATRVARAIYQGPYEGLGEAWGAFKAWVAAQGLTGRDDLYERYLVGPESTTDGTQFRTELNQPLV
ncbi:MAG: GyrI-like domain-containing protein [Polyangiales bacterium]